MIVEKYKQDTEYCTFCPKMCRFVCPTGIAEARETVTPTGKQTTLYLVQREAAPLDADTASVFYHCTNCGLCTMYCDHGINPYPAMEGARAAAVSAGVVLPAVRTVADNFSQFGNPYGNLFPAYSSVGGDRIVSQAQVYYVPDVSMLNRSTERLRSVLRVLDMLEAENVALWPGPMLGTGYELLTLGFTDQFREHASSFADAAGTAKTLIFASPHDLETVQERYPEFGVALEAQLVSETEWLRGRLEERPARGTPRRVLYHDSCTLGRKLGEYDGPREIIRIVNGMEPLEFAWNRDDSKCCGWGGGYAFTNPESARRIAALRIEEASEQRFDEIVTASPACAGQLQEAAGSRVPVYDLMRWLVERLA